jgi:hypothetical protein
LIGAESLYGLGDLVDHIHELGGFGRGNPGKVQPSGLDTHVFHQIIEQGEFAARVIITFQVMAFSRMSPGHPHAVGTFFERRQCKFNAHSPGAGDPDHADIGWILHTPHTRKIRGTVAAPVTQETDYFGFPVRHYGFLPMTECETLIDVEYLSKNLIVVKAFEVDGA